MSKRFWEGKPCNGRLYIIEETGDRDSMCWTPEYLRIKRETPGYGLRGLFGVPYEVDRLNEEATCGRLTIYDGSTGMVSDTTIYKAKRGHYIKKSGRKYYLHDFITEAEQEGAKDE